MSNADAPFRAVFYRGEPGRLYETFNPFPRLIASPLFKGVGDDAVTFGGSMDVGKEAAHPGVGTDVGVGCFWAAEGGEHVHNSTVAADIAGKVLIEGLRESDRIRTDVLVGIVEVHQYQIACK